MDVRQPEKVQEDVVGGAADTGGVRTLPGVIGWVVVVLGLPLATVTGLVLVWRGPTRAEVTVGVAAYTFAGLGISLGWHRYFTHRGFRCGALLTRLLAVAGSTAMEGSLASWVANHRVHHMRTDVPGDPHSPWTERGRVRGFLHAHVGWLTRSGASEKRYAREVINDASLNRISRFWWVYALGAMLAPAAVAAVFGGANAFWGMLLWAGALRVVLFHHVTWSVNSICHLTGSRRFDVADQSRNVWWLALLSFGESWHNNHHHAPRSARHGVGRLEVDISATLLRLLERAGLVNDCHWGAREGLSKGRSTRTRT